MKNKLKKYLAIFALSLVIPPLAFWAYTMLWSLGIKLPINPLPLELELDRTEQFLLEIFLFLGLPILAIIIGIALRKYKNPIVGWTIVAAIFLLLLALISIPYMI